ncbi:MAG: DUF1129 domain-containing protein [Candidatus Aenigmarchaeota archaeon]|nr:DUF1129 domain-containing protein [Candidatus Aenigmarchaeota archaeon]
MYDFFLIYNFLLRVVGFIISAFMVFYSHKLVKNLKKKEKIAMLKIFNQKRSVEAFKVLSISSLVFLVGMIIFIIFPLEPWITWVIGCVSFSGCIYFLKTLSEITEEK